MDEHQSLEIWNSGGPAAVIIPPAIAGPMVGIVERTLNGYFGEALGRTLPVADRPTTTCANIVAGNARNNPTLRALVSQGLTEPDPAELGDEGFRLVTFSCDLGRFVSIQAETPIGLKHGCQELAFFRTRATLENAVVDWPMDETRRPQFAYRGVYMLPCWAAWDSLASWERVLRFHSELTLNRNWFWLCGFPLLPEYGGQYAGSDLACPGNVRRLIDLCHREGMKFLIGGGWFNWHHEQHSGGSMERGVQYYLDLLDLLPEADGLYLEPTGEGVSAAETAWRAHMDAMQRLVRTALERNPQYEFALAIGRFNTPAYRQILHALDDRRLYWWWCWGDPIRDGATAEHPLVLRWHTVVTMSEYHGSGAPPQPEELSLTGFATSYDPGMGYGNPWNGWGKLGVDEPREFHPHTMPYFSHQYRFRERCWDVHQSESTFAARLARRLFDADVPGAAIGYYLRLAELCPHPALAPAAVLAEIETFVRRCAGQGTPRNRDTLLRMREALDGIRSCAATTQP